MHHAMYQETVACNMYGGEEDIRYIVSTGITPAILVEVACDSCNWTNVCKECLARHKSEYAKEHSLITR